jgi:hypothetical protein
LVLGPVFADFALRLWVLLSSLEGRDDAALLFCARGGLRLRLIYERFLAVCGLPSPLPAHDLMVSRVVAVRVALASGCATAYEQIGYEMGHFSLRQVARAIGGDSWVADDHGGRLLDEPYTDHGFARLLASDAGRPGRANIDRQAALFREHLDGLLAERNHAILCDSGLSGSTMRLLEDGMPDHRWGCALFARSNYKKLSTPHYRRTIGLSIQSDGYSPFDERSAILRYWHLIESTLEPDLPSVSTFDRIDGAVRSNLETPGWKAKVDPMPHELYLGIIDYIEQLPRAQAMARILADVGPAYARLRRAVIYPTRADVDTLNLGARSLDFGRFDDMSGPVCEPGLSKALRGSLWREGAVTLAAKGLSGPILSGIEAAHVARWAMRSLRTRSIAS